MSFRARLLAAFIGASLFCSFTNAQQQPVASTSSAVVPRLVNFSGKTADTEGKILTGIAEATFAIYKDQYEGAPLWMETQNVSADVKGNYTVQLGATKPDGLPLDLFTSGEARWLGVTINSGSEQPRILLLSVPYALKAADAETIGGLPPSAFVLANKSQGIGAETPTGATVAATKNNAAPPANPAVTGKGVVDFIPMWNSASDIVDSVMFQKSSQIGVNTNAPAATLDVNGKGDVRDTLTLFPNGTDPTLSISGTAFNVDQTGKVTFIKGQKFPGTVTGVTGVTAGTGLTGGGNGGKVTLNLDTTEVPMLAAANVFTNNQAISGGSGTWGLTVSQPNYLTILAQAPLAGVGTALEMQTTGTGGMFWQILNTGTGASQGANKLNFRNDSAAVDVMTLTASGQVGIGTTSPTATLDVQGNVSQARSAGGMVKAMVFVNAYTAPYSILRCFNSALSGAAATTPPCGINFTEDGFGSGYWDFDFGFEIDDRFFSLTSKQSAGMYPPVFHTCLGADPISPNTVQVLTSDCSGNTVGDYFYLIVY